jgi:hypothetical protein
VALVSPDLLAAIGVALMIGGLVLLGGLALWMWRQGGIHDGR